MKTLLSFRPIYKAKYHAIDPNLQLLLISFREHTYMMSDFRRGGSSKIGHGGSIGVGGLSNIGRPIILQFFPFFFQVLFFPY